MAVRLNVEEYPCIQHERGENCGPRWFQVTAEGQTIGTCGVHHVRSSDEPPAVAPFSDDQLPLSAHLTTKGATRTLRLADAHDDTVAAIAWTAEEKK